MCKHHAFAQNYNHAMPSGETSTENFMYTFKEHKKFRNLYLILYHCSCMYNYMLSSCSNFLDKTSFSQVVVVSFFQPTSLLSMNVGAVRTDISCVVCFSIRSLAIFKTSVLASRTVCAVVCLAARSKHGICPFGCFH